jgi:hypothetical protein
MTIGETYLKAHEEGKIKLLPSEKAQLEKYGYIKE